ncbi:hypothetical protein Cs7R123_59550 [Catellatospora sp. TT07R-123]|nr:hypothetical protein Cs7R123_59550 [Catellatospora sp. TT07R-123]
MRVKGTGNGAATLHREIPHDGATVGGQKRGVPLVAAPNKAKPGEIVEVSTVAAGRAGLNAVSGKLRESGLGFLQFPRKCRSAWAGQPLTEPASRPRTK